MVVAVAAYAAEDAPGELADEVLHEADRRGITIPASTADDHWPDWADQ